jgi:voltage-gated potassium channel
MIRPVAVTARGYTRRVISQRRATDRVESRRVRFDSITVNHLRIWVLLVLGIAAFGTAGYVVLQGWSIGDALYMTVITLTTVGYKEVGELDQLGRIWTMLLSIAAVGIIFGTVGLVAEGLLAEVASGRREARRMERAVAELRDHFIICGYGRVGSMVAGELVEGGQRVVVVDIRPESLDHARADGLLVVAGDGTSDSVLIEAGVERARGLVTAIDSDANNVYVTLSARALNPTLFIVGRASAVGAEAKVLQAGANRVVSPYTMAGRRIAELALRPRVIEFIDAALSQGELAFSMEEVEVGAGGPLDGRTVGALRSEGIFTLAVVRGPGAYDPNPPDERVVAVGETLIVSGSAETLRRLREQV